MPSGHGRVNGRVGFLIHAISLLFQDPRGLVLHTIILQLPYQTGFSGLPLGVAFLSVPTNPHGFSETSPVRRQLNIALGFHGTGTYAPISPGTTQTGEPEANTRNITRQSWPLSV